MSREREPGGSATGAGVRASASRINATVVRDGRSLDAALREGADPSSRDAPLLRALCYGSVRWHHRLQWQAGQLLKRPLKRRDAELAALIRIGLYQLQWLRVPDHAAVAATVAAADLLGKGHARGLVNAVLRRFLREGEELASTMEGVAEASTSHPSWMLATLKSDWPQAWEEIVSANNAAPPMWLRVNVTRGSRARYLARLDAAGIPAGAAEEPSSAILLAEPRATRALPGFGEGAVSVQDAAAQLAAEFLDLQPGQRVLDACAAPGGKSAHMLESCPGIGELVALDADAERLAVVAAEFGRLGLTGNLIHGDAALPAQWWDGRPFQRILLDAPCSALGVIRRHPDIKVLRRPGDIVRVVARQRELLTALWPLLAPGGRLVYATCTIVKDENQHQIQRFLGETATAREPRGLARSTRQILPGEANMDGFYYACLEKAE